MEVLSKKGVLLLLTDELRPLLQTKIWVGIQPHAVSKTQIVANVDVKRLYPASKDTPGLHNL
jgi:hypothetical protein